jgi:glutamyl-tRNA reductase
MTLLVCGLNHRTAPLSLREKVAFPEEQMPHFLRDLFARPAISEVVILSTCNRTELYCTGTAAAAEELVAWLLAQSKLLLCDLLPHLYFYRADKAVSHVMRVASGLDSLVLGEPQILGQIKTAYHLAQAAGTVDGKLQRLFQQVFAVTKRVRTDTEIGANPVSVSFAAVDLAKRIFGDLRKARVLLIGAGDTTQLVGRYLFQEGVQHITVANRTLEKSIDLAQQFAGNAIMLSAIPDHLAEVDIVVTATASQLPILGKGAIERALKTRKHRPMFLVDLAVPRDIEPEVEQLHDVFLYTVDDLADVVQENKKHRQTAAEQAELIVQEETQHFIQNLQVLKVVDTLREYRQNMEQIRDELLTKACQQLQQGVPAEQVLQQLARLLTNKFMHQPCIQLKQASYEGDEETLTLMQRLLLQKS